MSKCFFTSFWVMEMPAGMVVVRIWCMRCMAAPVVDERGMLTVKTTPRARSQLMVQLEHVSITPLMAAECQGGGMEFRMVL